MAVGSCQLSVVSCQLSAKTISYLPRLPPTQRGSAKSGLKGGWPGDRAGAHRVPRRNHPKAYLCATLLCQLPTANCQLRPADVPLAVPCYREAVLEQSAGWFVEKGGAGADLQCPGAGGCKWQGGSVLAGSLEGEGFQIGRLGVRLERRWDCGTTGLLFQNRGEQNTQCACAFDVRRY